MVQKSNSQGAGYNTNSGPDHFLRHNQEFAEIYYNERWSIFRFLES